jgi:hypothetical protein
MLRSADAPVWRAPAQAQRALPIESQRSPNGRTPSRKNHRWATGVAFFLADEHGKPSVHPLRGDEIRALRELQRQFQDSKHVFGTERGGPFTPDAVNRLIKRIGERAGFDFLVHVHMLRHACGYALANAGHDTRALQDWLGISRSSIPCAIPSWHRPGSRISGADPGCRTVAREELRVRAPSLHEEQVFSARRQ